MVFLRPLNELSSNDLASVGGKAARLGDLAHGGFPVPEGFVLTLEAFQAHFTHPDRHRPDRPALREDLLSELLSCADTLWPEDVPPLAVRSSGLGEDGRDASFAGAHATYYYVTKDRLADAVVDCWMSLWNPEALAYRKRMAPDEPFEMAVIVQRMVRATSSGVAFTSDPTGRRPDEMTIESVWGLGAALVDGRVSPDQFRIAQDFAVVEKRIARKRFKVDESLADAGVERLQPLASHLQAAPSLDDAQVKTLATMVRRVADLYGADQDVEWAYEGDTLYLLQTRPITTSGFETDAPEGEWVVFKPMLENFTDPLTPLSVDLFERILPRVVRFIDGRCYLNLGFLRMLVPLKVDDAQLVDLALLRGDADQFVHAGLNWRRVPGFLAFMGFAWLANGAFWYRTAHMTHTGLARFASLIERLRNSPKIDALASLRRLFQGNHPWHPAGHYVYQVNVSAGRYFLFMGLLRRVLPWAAPEFPPSRVGELCRGSEEMASRDMVEGLRHLAALAGDNVAIREVITSQEPSELAAILADLDSRHEFVVALRAFLRTHGHRCVKELELMSVRWREDPTPVIAMIKNHLDSPAGDIDPHARHLVARDELHQCLRSRPARWLVEYLIRRTSYYVDLRENTRYYHTMGFDLVRRKLKTAEQHLIYDSKLKCADDIFFLHWDEVEALERDEANWQQLEARVRDRRQRWLECARQQPPDTVGVDLAPRDDADSLTGQCASAGFAQGTARVIFDPTLCDSFEQGDVLVAPHTDPAWTPLFPRASAVVVGVGSFLSHAGTIAREYGIPCLVDVSGCTERITSGQTVRVYATEGYLEVLDA